MLLSRWFWSETYDVENWNSLPILTSTTSTFSSSSPFLFVSRENFYPFLEAFFSLSLSLVSAYDNWEKIVAGLRPMLSHSSKFEQYENAFNSFVSFERIREAFPFPSSFFFFYSSRFTYLSVLYSFLSSLPRDEEETIVINVDARFSSPPPPSSEQSTYRLGFHAVKFRCYCLHIPGQPVINFRSFREAPLPIDY